MKAIAISSVLLALAAIPASSMAQDMPRTAAPADANVYIISPQDGEVVPETFTVKFGLSGMGVAPAGIDKANTGHHHLLVDHDELPALDQPMGSDVMHFGGGQTETTLTLSPGKHTLQLIMGDMSHVPLKPAVVSKKITVEVKAK
ncbi:rod shape-determining protein RodA [Idiomarina tyrosinivorans]|uniref:Rod shape-determining protein RodA n=1 Tax=Idiomarina tyrosinivorans TaxID=1445662 RepID=A0A432ZT42_9GAMM|nr:DUF4399 domain-containing protein [Idiomarina tyrosinivorans]RUO81104.1 rod shape-determining protein RodA [Idiomarina tyrosinivorans]